MSTCRHALTIDGRPVALALYADTMRQTYRRLGGAGLLRMGDGSGVLQTRWSRLATALIGGGVLPAPLAAIDEGVPLLLGCIAPRAVHCPAPAAPVATLPAARRTDAAPFALAALPGGQLRPAALTLVGDVATVALVAGAVAYQVCYYPLLTVACTDVRETWSPLDGAAQWEMDFEEV